MKRSLNHHQSINGDGVDVILLLKAVVAMAAIAIAAVGSVAPEFVESGLSWGQGVVAFLGGSLGAFLTLHK